MDMTKYYHQEYLKDMVNRGIAIKIYAGTYDDCLNAKKVLEGENSFWGIRFNISEKANSCCLLADIKAESIHEAKSSLITYLIEKMLRNADNK